MRAVCNSFFLEAKDFVKRKGNRRTWNAFRNEAT